MSVCNGFTIETYGFMHSLLTCAANGAIAMEDSEDISIGRVKFWSIVLKYS